MNKCLALAVFFLILAAACAGSALAGESIAAMGEASFTAADDVLAESLRVELRAPSMVMLSAPVSGRLAAVAARDGETVAKGQVLVQIDDRLHQLRLDSAKASRNQAGAQLALARKLHALGSRGALDVSIAQAQFDAADAEMRLAAELVGLCRVVAPWNGRISQLDVKENQHVAEGSPLLEIAAEGPLEVEFMMPSSWIGKIGKASAITIQVDETGRRYMAELIRLGGKVDPLTQSIHAYAKLVDSDDALLPGMTGLMILPEVANGETPAGRNTYSGR